jgi:hypothetical protein
VLLTERQRLELHPELDWPYRVSGTQIGAAVYRQRYGGPVPAARTDLGAGGFADARFASFFQTYGGLPVFGYPISGMLRERDAQGGEVAVQYFERARFELVPGVATDAPLAAQVRLGALGREFAGIEAWCGIAPTPSAAPAATAQPAAQVQPLAIAPAPIAGRAPWFWPVLAVLLIALLATVGWGVRLWADLRRRRSGPVYAPPLRRARHAQSDEALLRDLLGGEQARRD